jgi:hypothetical protein
MLYSRENNLDLLVESRSTHEGSGVTDISTHQFDNHLRRLKDKADQQANHSSAQCLDTRVTGLQFSTTLIRRRKRLPLITCRSYTQKPLPREPLKQLGLTKNQNQRPYNR